MPEPELPDHERLAHLRRTYRRGGLDERDLAPTWTAQLLRWLDDAEAAGVLEINAMVLATADAGGRPRARTVLLKGLDERGLVFFTNYGSRKGRELAANPHAALQFHWPERERVVRVEGVAERTSAEESDAYFVTRPLDSRIGAWASPQSEVIASRGVLLSNAAKASARYGLNPPRPEHWGGFRVVPDTWEFWQGRRSRLHDRVRFRLADGSWLKERLAP